MKKLTPKQREEKYNNLLKNVNLTKLGALLLKKSVNNKEDGIYNEYTFLHRYLRMNGIGSSYVIPTNIKVFYGDDLKTKAYNAFFTSLGFV